MSEEIVVVEKEKGKEVQCALDDYWAVLMLSNLSHALSQGFIRRHRQNCGNYDHPRPRSCATGK